MIDIELLIFNRTNSTCLKCFTIPSDYQVLILEASYILILMFHWIEDFMTHQLEALIALITTNVSSLFKTKLNELLYLSSRKTTNCQKQAFENSRILRSSKMISLRILHCTFSHCLWFSHFCTRPKQSLR